MLLGPVADQLGTKRLLIVAEGALQYSARLGRCPCQAKVTGHWDVETRGSFWTRRHGAAKMLRSLSWLNMKSHTCRQRQCWRGCAMKPAIAKRPARQSL